MNIYMGYLIFIFLIEIPEIEIDIVLFTFLPFLRFFTFLLFYQAYQYLTQFSVTNLPETRFESQGDYDRTLPESAE